MNNDEFVVHLKKQMRACPYKNWRKGQVAFNTLHMLRPKLANRVRATELDPFYYDDNTHVAAFMEWVRKNYNEDKDDEITRYADDS